MRSSWHARLTALACAVAVGFSPVAGCAKAPVADTRPKSVQESALTGLLLASDDIGAVMATDKMTAHPLVVQMADHRNLLPNLNCLGVWQVDEAPIYDPSGWQSMRQQMLRAPDNDSWDSLVVQSVVRYDTAEAAQRFFTESADRWAHCTNHRVTIRLNDQPLPAWRSGDMTASESKLTLPYVRGSGAQVRPCQRVLALAANVILDIQACRPRQSTAVTQAGDIADRITARLPR